MNTILDKKYFLPYQEKWIKDEAALKLYEKSRRIGITYGTSYRSFNKCLKQSNISKFVQWVSSRDETTAKEFITDYVAMWAHAANVVAKGLLGDDVQVLDEDKGIRAFVVEFDNGSRIYSLSSNPKAFAGKGGDILIDEFDLHRNQGDLYDMAFPCITWGGQLEIVSAYDSNGSEHTVFAQLVKECKVDGNPKGFSLHSTTLTEAVEQGFVEKVNEVKARKGRPTQSREEFVAGIRKSCRTHAAYLSQYECIPNSANGQQAVRPNDLLNSKKGIEILQVDLTGDAGTKDIIDPAAESYIDMDFWKTNITGFERYSFGYDVARKHDLASIWVDGMIRGVYQHIGLILFRNCKFETQKQLAESIMKELLIVGAGDETGMGGPNCEHLATLFPERFVPVNFASLKVTLGTLMVEIFENQRQLLPLKPPMIASDIAGIRKDTGLNGKLLFTEAANPHEPQSHCDMAWSCALSKYAGETIEYFGSCWAASIEEDETNSLDPFRQFMCPKRDEFKAENDWPY